MRLLLCSAVFATAIFGVYGFPTDLTEPEVPRRGVSPNNKPQLGVLGGEKPRPNTLSKPTPQIPDSAQGSQSPSSFILEAASVVSSELPSAESMADNPDVIINSGHVAAEPAHDPILETSNTFPAPETVVQDALPDIESPAIAVPVIEPEVLAAVPVLEPEVLAEVPVIEPAVLAADHSAATDAVSAAVAQFPETDSSVQDVETHLDNSNVKVSVPLISGKSRRHAGVEAPSALRIGDFEDVEADSGMAAPGYPATQEVEFNHELSKEEMILVAMEQMHHNLPQNAARPAANRPNLLNTNSSPVGLNAGSLLGKPQSHQSHFDDREEEDEAEDEDSSENDSTVDLRNGESATIVQEQPVVPSVSKVVQSSKPEVHSPYSSGSRHKPRPYGMDKPSKNRPTLDSGMKDKNEHFGLPHSSASNDYIQKGEMGVPSDSGTISYLGFQIPNIKWSSFTDLFPTFWGNANNRQHGMGKSDQSLDQSETCVDDDAVNDGVRSPVIQGHALCQASGVPNTCYETCVNNGFASGTCLGPYPTPGCMCRMPNSKEFGMALKPLEESNRVQDLETSASPACKKCKCMDACKKSGSFTGFCVDRCYCAVPWYTKQV